jgi:hypothetical protein
MDQRRTACLPAISIGLFAAILALHSSRLLAASDCVEEPRHPPAQGGDWYYHADRATGGKCWHLGREPAAIAPQVETAPQPPHPDTVQLLSWFLSSLFTPASTPQPDTINRDMRPAVAQPEPRRDDRGPKRRRQAEAKPAPEPKPASSASSEQADRDALFREYLRWREQQ